MTGDDSLTKKSNLFLEGSCDYTRWLARDRDTALTEADGLREALKDANRRAHMFALHCDELTAERDKLREMVDRYFLVIYTLQQQIPDERRKDAAEAVVKALEAE